MSVTDKILDFAETYGKYENLPPEVIHEVKMLLIDLPDGVEGKGIARAVAHSRLVGGERLIAYYLEGVVVLHLFVLGCDNHAPAEFLLNHAGVIHDCIGNAVNVRRKRVIE